MKKFLPGFVGLICILGTSLEAQQVHHGTAAATIVPGASMVRMQPFSAVPNYIRFQEGQEPAAHELETILRAFMATPEDFSLQLIGTESDRLGQVHYRYQQLHRGIPVAMGTYIAHTFNGQLLSANGELFDQVEATTPTLTEAQALVLALEHVGANTYKWEVPSEERFLQDFRKDPQATFYPSGELVIASTDVDLNRASHALAYKFDIHAHEPFGETEVFVDAADGAILYENSLVHHADSAGTAVTGYYGQQPITADFTGTEFRLRETGRGGGIITRDLNGGTGFGGAVDFTDDDNVWNNANPVQDEFAGDAHWAAELAYDYFLNVHNRDSYDGAGAPINVYVHFGVNVTNAFFNFAGIAFGDGGAGTDPLTTIDVVTHELGHGVSATTADFDSQREPGALNESFSDIFGTAVEFQTLGNSGADWIIASEIGPAIRNMEDPNALNDPDTYGGLNWIEQEGCNPSPFNNQCGIHINAGVQNFWFYLLVNGGTGTNDIGDAYSVTGIGMDKAADIAYRNLTTYLTSTSGFFDARFYSIQSALDLFGACSPEVEATTRAWYAVGVGPDYLPFVQSGFTADNTRECESPFPVSFSQNSSNATSFAWDFGDGNTSTMPNPTHVYTGTGEFDVTLIVSSSCGADTLARPAFVQVLPPSVPTAADAQICEDSTATLGASTPFGGIFRWYDSPAGGNLLLVGDSFTTPPLMVSTTYYVQNDQFNSGIPLGPADSTLGPATTDNGSNGLVFTLFDTQELASVKVFAQGAGPRTIEVHDEQGTLLDARTVDLTDGEQRVPLNFLLPTGGNYELIATGSNINLGYNIGGANYPYIEIGRGAITRSTDAANPTSAYHYFYDWELRDVCSSDREPVTVNVCPVGTQELLNNWQLSVFPNPADDQVQLSLNPQRDAVVEVWLTDLHGRLTGTQIRRSLSTGQQHIVVPVAGLAEGLYLLHLETDRGKLVRKLAIMR